MACCWYPLTYHGTGYTEGQMSNVAWWHNMGDNHYVQGDYFEATLVSTTGTAIRSFMSGRPEFFPVGQKIDKKYYDPFGTLRDALSRVLFHPEEKLNRVHIGNIGQPIKSFDRLNTRHTGNLGATLNIIFIVAPLLKTFQHSDGPVHTYGWNTTPITEAMRPGFWKKYDFERDVNQEDAADEIPWLKTLMAQEEAILEAISDDLMSNPSATAPDITPVRFYRQEIFVPYLTQDGGEFVMETYVYRANGAQRLKIDLSRYVKPHTITGMDKGFTVQQVNKAPFYVVGVKEQEWEAARITGAGTVPNAIWTSGIANAALGDGPTGTKTIVDYHEENYGGELTDNATLRINGEEYEFEAEQTTSYELAQELRNSFLNVQDYAPPTEFEKIQTDSTPSELESYKLPNLALEEVTETSIATAPPAPIQGLIRPVKVEIVKPLPLPVLEQDKPTPEAPPDDGFDWLSFSTDIFPVDPWQAHDQYNYGWIDQHSFLQSLDESHMFKYDHDEQVIHIKNPKHLGFDHAYKGLFTESQNPWNSGHASDENAPRLNEYSSFFLYLLVWRKDNDTYIPLLPNYTGTGDAALKHYSHALSKPCDVGYFNNWPLQHTTINGTAMFPTGWAWGMWLESFIAINPWQTSENKLKFNHIQIIESDLIRYTDSDEAPVPSQDFDTEEYTKIRPFMKYESDIVSRAWLLNVISRMYSNTYTPWNDEAQRGLYGIKTPQLIESIDQPLEVIEI